MPPRLPSRPQPPAKIPAIQYSNGMDKTRANDKARPVTGYVGFHIENKNDELNDACRQAGFETLEFHHNNGNRSVHWDLGEDVLVFALSTGPVASTIFGATNDPDTTARVGIGASWDGRESRLAIRCYVWPLLQVGWTNLLTLGVTSRMTEHLYPALIRHRDVCLEADTLLDRRALLAKEMSEDDLQMLEAEGEDLSQVGFFDLALPLKANNEDRDFGKEAGKISRAYPIVSGHPDKIDAAYLQELWRPSGVPALIERDWPGIEDWARRYASFGMNGRRTGPVANETVDQF